MRSISLGRMVKRLVPARDGLTGGLITYNGEGVYEERWQPSIWRVEACPLCQLEFHKTVCATRAGWTPFLKVEG